MASINEGREAFNMADLLNSLLTGWIFKPTDQDIIQSYLTRKIRNLPLPAEMIQDLNACQYTLEQLNENYDKSYLYFFTTRDREHLSGEWFSCAVSDGYWKATGTDDAILCDKKTIGFKKAFHFYTENAPTVLETNWVMHEYRLPENEDNLTKHSKLDTVLCKIFKMKKKKTKTQDKAAMKTKKLHDRDESNDEDPKDDDEDPIDDDEDPINSTDLMNSNSPNNKKEKRPTKQQKFL